MKRFLMVDLLAVVLLAGCTVGLAPAGYGGAVVVPALPTVVVLEVEPYYQQSGYFYFYQNNHWSYSKSKNGPWAELPRDRYPKEVKYKGQGGEGGQDKKHGHDKHD